ncbi:MAG: hypothetical protein WB789_03700 [Thermoplasmata archaeon]
MTEPDPPVWHIAAVLVVLGLASAGGLVFAPSPSTPSCGTNLLTSYCNLVRGNVTYASEDVEIPANASGWGPVTHLTFHGVQFRLWPELPSPDGVFLQGTGIEPDGVDLAFVVLPNNSSTAGNPPPTNGEVQTWFSPDGDFGVTWLGELGQWVSLRLSVADPGITYALESVTLAAVNAPQPENFTFQGVSFGLQVEGYFSPAGPSLVASVAEPNGTHVHLAEWAGPLLACGTVGDTPTGILDHSTCLYTGLPEQGVALLWDGYLTVTLMVRVG